MRDDALEAAMARYARGDESAFATLYDGVAPAVYRLLAKMSRDDALAEDLTHETFLRIHRARATYREGAKVMPWAFAIARRLFLDSARRKKMISLDAPRDGEEPTSDPGIAAPGPTAEEHAVAERLASIIEGILADIPENQATAFRLLKQEGMSIAEAAAVLGATETTVKLRAHRAYVTLRERVGQSWDLSDFEVAS